ncbi:hypothetical protein SADUNF_Sadunf16G0275300 [Salix dunnii]|uniref:Uncharacterized protein n=1 Tax=Salix dunnii TaxID=1413687 RepID=A0A835JCF3_9ROSI|nr:hypothetical protein SADUNF_Sadunf16G0275300 [Salix dunnii]
MRVRTRFNPSSEDEKKHKLPFDQPPPLLFKLKMKMIICDIRVTAMATSSIFHAKSRIDVSSSNQYVKASKPYNPVPAYYSQITELKLSVDQFEKKMDFYFAKLRNRGIEQLPVVVALTSLLCSTDDDASVFVEAQAIVFHC